MSTSATLGRFPALVRFMEARSDTSGRASARAGLQACRALSTLLDAALVELTGNESPFALVAVGGTGRGEQCRHSDIDVMLLVPRERDDQAARSLYPLWDAQLKVGHSVRTPHEACAAAAQNIETFTALLDARFLAGDAALFERFEHDWQRVVRSKQGWLREELRAAQDATRKREPWQVMAVDLKNSRGGLRSVQAVHWLATAEAIASGGEPKPLDIAIFEARERLLATRNAVHALAARPSDVFRPEATSAVGEWLGVNGFDWARELYAAMRAVDAAVEERLPAAPARRRWWSWPARHEEEPEPIGGGDGDLRDLGRALAAVEPGGPLEPLPPASWLARLLPEWEILRHRPHIAPFHVNPVDVHAVRAVSEAKRVMEHDDFGTGSPAVASEFGRPEEVLLAALLHDIGKGHRGDHSEAGAVIAERFSARAALEPEARQRLVSAVRLHLLLPAVATRRDIADAQVIEETAAAIGDVQTLRLLYLVSVADARASGPNVWSAWKAQLMRTLYLRLLAALDATGAVATPLSESIVAELAGRFPVELVLGHLDAMGDDYLISTPPHVVGDHLALIEEAQHGTATRLDRLGEFDRLTLVTRDRPGLLQAIAGTLAGHNATVLGGVAHTRRDGIAIQVWHVRDALGHGIDERRWGRLVEAVPHAVSGTFDIDQRLAEVRARYPEPARPAVPTTVHVDNHASRDYSILEVSTADRRGLLYAVTRALHEQGIDIHLAKVDTIGPEVVDAFYVRRHNGRRIDDPDEVERLCARIGEVIAALDG